MAIERAGSFVLAKMPVSVRLRRVRGAFCSTWPCAEVLATAAACASGATGRPNSATANKERTSNGFVAAAELAFAPAPAKREALLAAAEAVRAGREAILAANGADLAYGAEKGLSAAMMDRLKLDAGRIAAIVKGLRDVAAQPDPVGEVIKEWDRPTGLHIRRVRTPIGVIGVIYESRPNVTADAAARHPR